MLPASRSLTYQPPSYMTHPSASRAFSGPYMRIDVTDRCDCECASMVAEVPPHFPQGTRIARVGLHHNPMNPAPPHFQQMIPSSCVLVEECRVFFGVSPQPSNKTLASPMAFPHSLHSGDGDRDGIRSGCQPVPRGTREPPAQCHPWHFCAERTETVPMQKGAPLPYHHHQHHSHHRRTTTRTTDTNNQHHRRQQHRRHHNLQPQCPPFCFLCVPGENNSISSTLGAPPFTVMLFKGTNRGLFVGCVGSKFFIWTVLLLSQDAFVYL